MSPCRPGVCRPAQVPLAGPCPLPFRLSPGLGQRRGEPSNLTPHGQLRHTTGSIWGVQEPKVRCPRRTVQRRRRPRPRDLQVPGSQYSPLPRRPPWHSLGYQTPSTAASCSHPIPNGVVRKGAGRRNEGETRAWGQSGRVRLHPGGVLGKKLQTALATRSINLRHCPHAVQFS